MRQGFYSVYYTGTAGSGVLMLFMKDGRLIGLDAVGGRLTGTFEARGETVAINMEIEFQPGELVTGQTLAQPYRLASQIVLPSNFFDGETVRTDIGTGPINARAEFRADPF